MIVETQAAFFFFLNNSIFLVPFSGIVQAQSASSPSNVYTFSLPAIYQEQFGVQEAGPSSTRLLALSSFDYESDSTLDVVVQAVSGTSTAVQHFTIHVSVSSL